MAAQGGRWREEIVKEFVVFLSMDRVSTRLVGSWGITLDSTYS